MPSQWIVKINKLLDHDAIVKNNLIEILVNHLIFSSFTRSFATYDSLSDCIFSHFLQALPIFLIFQVAPAIHSVPLSGIVKFQFLSAIGFSAIKDQYSCSCYWQKLRFIRYSPNSTLLWQRIIHLNRVLNIVLQTFQRCLSSQCPPYWFSFHFQLPFVSEYEFVCALRFQSVWNSFDSIAPHSTSPVRIMVWERSAEYQRR